MKLNKKVFAGALALAMGLGVVAPAANSYAADNDPAGQVAVTEDYRKAEKAYVAALKDLKEAEANLEKAKKAEDETYKAFQEATKAVKDHEAKSQSLFEDRDLAYKELKKSVDNYNSTTGESKTYNEIIAAYKLVHDKVLVVDNNQIVEDTSKSDAIKSVLGSYDHWQRAIAAHEAELAKYDNLIAARDTAKKKYDDAVRARKLAQEKYDAAKKVYDAAKEVFIKEGANKNTIDLAEKNGIYVPEEDPEADKDLTEKIEASLKANKEKLSALKAVKKYMPESYKKYKKVIDEAVEEAEKAIKQAEDFLGKKVAFLTVAHASDATNEPTAEEVLKDLEDSEKKLDDAINQVEQDNKEQNEAEEENKKEEEKPADKEEEEKPADKEEEKKPEVTEKEDKTPSKNVKTGVAGVAGVGAVLAAASAAYVSSKRK